MDLMNKLLYWRTLNVLFYVTDKVEDGIDITYVGNFYDNVHSYGPRCSFAKKDLVWGIEHNFIYVARNGDVLIDSYGREFDTTHVVPAFYGSECPGSYWGVDYTTFVQRSWKIKLTDDAAGKIVKTNKNRTTCFKCKCPTENRRDFSDMSIREFCPRCKI